MPSIITRGGMSAKGFGFGASTGVKFNGFTVSSVSTPGTSFLPQDVTVNSSGLFVISGGTSFGYPGFISTSNGTSWSSLTIPQTVGINYPQPTKIAVNSSGLFVSGSTSDTGFGVLVAETSTNGTTWSNMTRYASLYGPTSIAVNSSGVFVVLGYTSNTAYSCSTSNGTSWSGSALAASDCKVSNLVAGLSGEFLFAYTVNSGSNNTVNMKRSTNNGATWTSYNMSASFDSQGASQRIAVNSTGLFVLVDKDSNGYLVSYTSTTGLSGSWSKSNINTSPLGNEIFTCICCTNYGLFIALSFASGTSAYYYTSKDGVSWTAPVAFGSDSTNFNGIACSSTGKVIASCNDNAATFLTMTVAVSI
jgi:hypothetical protein